MEDAKTTRNEQLAYQQERFPMVADTDDLVFELGKQIVDRINKEKLLGNLLKKVTAVETQIAEAKSKQVSLEESNKIYEENNRALDAEIVKLRSENSRQIAEIKRLKEKKKLQKEKK